MINETLDPMSFFVSLVLTQPDGFVEHQPSREPDPSFAICSTRQALPLQRLTDIHGTAKCATHTDVSWRYLEYGSRAGCKPAPRGQFERKGLTMDMNSERRLAAS